jgi:hypothetical protein
MELVAMGGVFPRMLSAGIVVVKEVNKDLESGSRITRLQQRLPLRILYDIARSSRTNVLLLLVPVGIPLNYLHVPPGVTFTINILAMVPLAGVLLLYH